MTLYGVNSFVIMLATVNPNLDSTTNFV